MEHLDLEDNTPLHVAAANGSENLVINLIIRGAEVDASNSFGWTPLMQAARNGHRSIVSILLKHGAHHEKRNKFGLTPLFLASVSGDVETVRLLLNSGAIYEFNEMTCLVSPLMVASLYKNEEIVRLFLDYNLGTNSMTPKTKISPVICAAAGGSVAIVKMLTEQGSKMEPFSPSLDTNHEGKLKSAVTPTLQTTKSYSQVFINEPTVSDPSEKTHRTGFSYPPETHPGFFSSERFTEINFPENADFSTFAKLSKIQADTLNTMTPPMIETKNLKEMPPGSVVKLAKQSYPFDCLTKKYTEGSQNRYLSDFQAGMIQTKAGDESRLPEAKMLGDEGARAKSSSKSPLAFSPQECTLDQYVRNFSKEEILKELIEVLHRANAFQD